MYKYNFSGAMDCYQADSGRRAANASANFLKISEQLDECLRRRIISEAKRKYKEAQAKLKADPNSIPKVVDTIVAKLILKISRMSSRTEKLNYFYSYLAEGKTPLDAKMSDQKRYRKVMQVCNFDKAQNRWKKAQENVNTTPIEKRKAETCYLLCHKLSEIIQ